MRMRILLSTSLLATTLFWLLACNRGIIRKALGEENFEVVPATEQSPPQPIILLRQFNQC